MRRADDPTTPEPAPVRASDSPISVALLAGIACVPLVVAVGFLTDRTAERPGAGAAAVPGDISVLALRGQFDDGERRPDLPSRAGY